MSTQILEGILLIPLIGTIDTHRAKQIGEQILDAIDTRHATVILIDITGVPTVDTSVAGHLIRLTRAVRLMGAESIITGINPHNAQTLVKLGVELGQIATKGSLQTGLKLAFELTKRKITKEA